MSGPVIHANFVDAIALPRVVWLRPNQIGLAFPLMKLLSARFIVRKALEEGELEPGGLIAETTSGTFGLALAMVARLQGHPLTLVSDPAIDAPLQRRLAWTRFRWARRTFDEVMRPGAGVLELVA